MRLGKPSRPLALSAAVVTVSAIGGVAFAASSAEATATGAGHGKYGCTTIDYFERTDKHDANKPLPDPRNVPVGLQLTYFDSVYDPSGTTKVGDAAGVNSMVEKRASDGHIIQYVTQQYTFADGSLVASGSMDRSDVIGQKWVGTPVYGTAGRYLGLAGTWTWRLVDLTDPTAPAVVKFTLCGRM
ncbi:allene oxide cyclase barrel-like domain-containing protein [Dactylosporangium salmoneum]|uniref:Allene oxide cyclase barrel-like domain-containing protein n=1 Tax=Dactylosporangium salmoneum TaxID=53361 RepID=A0ABP5T704_9ACTN